RAWESLRTVIEGALHGRVAPPGTEVPMVEIRVR
ncbi:MAG: nitroreductase family deazaflavin-dependent oxidoreductase, partial [Lysobacterales bacterium]